MVLVALLTSTCVHLAAYAAEFTDTHVAYFAPNGGGLLVLGFIAAVLLFALKLTAAQNRRYEAETRPRLCRSCALCHPPFAHYCRYCGRKL